MDTDGCALWIQDDLCERLDTHSHGWLCVLVKYICGCVSCGLVYLLSTFVVVLVVRV